MKSVTMCTLSWHLLHAIYLMHSNTCMVDGALRVFEMEYMPTMREVKAYETVYHVTNTWQTRLGSRLWMWN